MTLIRYPKSDLSPWAPLDLVSSFREDFNRLFESNLGSVFREARMLGDWAPALDVVEETDAFVVIAELPGMEKDQIDLSFHNGLLTISGERRASKESSEGQPHRSERYFGKFSRSVSIPTPVDANQITATHKDGILTVRLPKSEEAKPRQITVSDN